MTLPTEPPTFLAGGGEMGERIRAHDWSATPLGPPSQWPQSLKTSVRLLLSTGHPMFIWWGPELVQFYNDAYCRSIGPERHPSALGQPGRECWVEIWDIIGPQIEKVLAGEGRTWHENQLVPITRHGRREDVYWTYGYSPIDDPSAPNGVGGVLVVCTETTAQVRTEQRLKAAEKRWRELFDQAPGFMCLLQGPEHRFEFANPRYHALVDQREIVGRTVGEALPELEHQGFVDLLDEVYRNGEPHSGRAIPVHLARQRGDDEKRFLDFVCQPIRDDEGEVSGIFVDGYDVTDRVRALETLRTEDRRKNDFLAMLAHELRNPLAPIRNAADLLTRRSLSEDRARALGERLGRQVDHLTRLVDDLLDLSRITQGRIELQRSTVDLARVAEAALESVAPLVREHRHDVTVTSSGAPLHVDGDLPRLVQCVSNLLANAAKYTEPGGEVRLETRAEGETAVLTVTDTGTGLSRNMQERIFEPFVQAERTLDRSQGGLGLGLSLVRHLVEMHGGEVSAESDGLGQGSTFRLVLPLAGPSDEADEDHSNVETARRRILVVDDNPDAADGLTELLHLEGHHVETTYGAREALERATASPPDVVLLDIGLPEMDGYEVAERLRNAGHTCTLVALTGYGRPDDVRRAEAAGFDAHLTKPVAFEDLKRILHAAG